MQPSRLPQLRHHEADDSSTSTSSADSATRSTDLDALVSRCSAANLGYIRDDYASLFLPPSQRHSQNSKRPPLINIGTHARTWAVDQLVRQFLQKARGVQVLSLGAGTDTRFWRMRDEWTRERPGQKWPCDRWVEVDFPESTSLKARTITIKPKLKEIIGSDYKIERGGTALVSPTYAVVPGDLRRLDDLSRMLLDPLGISSLNGPLLDPSKPTLLLLECVLFYLPSSNRKMILEWFVKTFRAPESFSMIVSYDPFGLQDAFGRVMLRNLANRGLAIPMDAGASSIEHQVDIFEQAGFKRARSMSIKQVRAKAIPPDELQRINLIEMIDEVEELNLVLDHYAVSYAFAYENAVATDDIGL
ncbi:carboxy methyl transferase for protein phosphatase 2A [Microbotryomycetes sp. JL201]|nr:carboxy methyl transferase for protein phosphatase 2A [Microbotryomycetes sp. JL201]